MRKNPLDVANDLITYYSKIYFAKFGKRPILNRGKMKFALTDVLQDWNQTEVKQFLEYYIKTESNPDLIDFCRRYDEIIQEKVVEENDAKTRKELMSETKQSVLRFREQFKGAK
jgi:hypothetical protein